nr:hypothetical protein GCM10025732_50980 [Glycomyces mayteni]
MVDGVARDHVGAPAELGEDRLQAGDERHGLHAVALDRAEEEPQVAHGGEAFAEVERGDLGEAGGEPPQGRGQGRDVGGGVHRGDGAQGRVGPERVQRGRAGPVEAGVVEGGAVAVHALSPFSGRARR